jgi:peptidoglycan/LPS O-acetylase OafA/YrhL
LGWAVGTTKFQMAHVPALDGMRAIAILIVLVAHAGAGKFVPGGFGVTIFFFLSGYLITSLLRVEASRTGKIDLRDFYFRRAIRILPPLYVTAAILAVLSIWGVFGRTLNLPSLVLDGAFLTNYDQLLPEKFLHSLPIPLWSLDVEEHFYLIFSTVFAVVMVHMKPTRAALICAVACAVILGIRFLDVVLLKDITVNYYWSHTRMDSILFGCILALWNNPAIDEHAWRPGKLTVIGAFALLALCLAVRGNLFRETIRYTLQGIALFVIFSAALHNRGMALRMLGSTPMKWIALISYTLYLVHFPIFLALERYQVPGAVVIGIALSLLYSLAMYWLVEYPLGEWRRNRRKGPKAKVFRGHLSGRARPSDT